MSDTQLALFRGPQARGCDPITAHVAAATITPGWAEYRIVAAFEVHGPLTDDELCRALNAEWWPTVKSARSRLSKRGLLVPTGEHRDSVRGCPQQVWQVSP